MIELFDRGGPVMYTLALCSLTALAVFLERLWGLRRNRVLPQTFVSRVNDLIDAKDSDTSLKVCKDYAFAPVARIAEAGIREMNEPAEIIRFVVTEAGSREAANLDRNQRVLATAAYIAPLLGLLGTVSGMIKAFDSISRHAAMGDPSLVAAGISEALITTAAGLLVAIPVVIMYNVIRSKAARRSLELEQVAVAIIRRLMKTGQACVQDSMNRRASSTKQGVGSSAEHAGERSAVPSAATG